MSGHSRGSRSGRQLISLRAHRTQGAFTAGVLRLPSRRMARTVSLSGEMANLVAARSATSSSSTSSMLFTLPGSAHVREDLAYG